MKLTYREIEHPRGRFRRENGSLFDICVMEVKNSRIPKSRLRGFPKGNYWPALDYVVEESYEKLTIGHD